MIDDIPTALIDAETERLGINIAGTIWNSPEAMTGIRPSRALTPLRGSETKPYVPPLFKIHASERLANITAMSVFLVFLQKDARLQIDARRKRVVTTQNRWKKYCVSKPCHRRFCLHLQAF